MNAGKYLTKGFLLLFILIIAVSFSCKSNSNPSSAIIKKQTSSNLVLTTTPKKNIENNELAAIDTNYGRIVLKFFPEVAPGHVANFKKLAREGFYDGTTFHRVIPGFMIQGGDPLSKDNNRQNDGTGDSGKKLQAEFNKKSHLRGALSMARGGHDDSASSQFFICVAPVPHLDGKYTLFGEVTEGMDTVDKIVNLERDARDNPLKPAIMKKVTIFKKEV